MSPGFCSWSIRHISWSSAVHGLWGAQEGLQQIQECALRCKTGESLSPSTWNCGNTVPVSESRKLFERQLMKWLSRFPSAHFSHPPHSSFVCFSGSTEFFGIYHNGGIIQNICCGHNVPVSGGASSPARPAQPIQRRAGCHQTDVEVQYRTHWAGGLKKLPPVPNPLLFAPQERRSRRLLQRHRSQRYPGHSCLLHHFCGVREHVCVPPEAKHKLSFQQRVGASWGEEQLLQTELSAEMIWIWDAFVCTLKVERAGESAIKMCWFFFRKKHFFIY